MFNNKDKAFELRKTGLSYRSISAQMGVPISTLSLWFKGQMWSQEIGKKIAETAANAGTLRLASHRKAHGFALQFAYARAKEDAAKEYKNLKKNPLFCAGITLYWALGDQSSVYYLRLRSADPQKIHLFHNFLVDVLAVSSLQIKYSLILSAGQKAPKLEEKWSVDAKIPIQSFTKSTFVRKPRSKMPKDSSVCTATYSSRILKEKMLVWLRLWPQEFDKAGIV